MINIFATLIDYKVSHNKPIVRVFGRSENGKRILRHVSGFEPCFYTLETEVIPLNMDPRIVRYENAPPSLYGDRTVRVVCNIPADVSGKDENQKYVKDNFKTVFESDILFGDKVRIQGNLSGTLSVPERTFISKDEIKPNPKAKKIPLRIQYNDIECFGGSIQDAKDGKSFIPCLTAYDNFLNEYHLFTVVPLTESDIEKIRYTIKEFWINSLNTLKVNLMTEKEDEKIKVLKKQIKYLDKNLKRILDSIIIKPHSYLTEEEELNGYIDFMVQTRPDVQAGWNFVDFDAPVTINRMKNLKLPYQRISDVNEAYVSHYGEAHVAGLVLMDLMNRYVEMQPSKPPHKGLDYIAKRELGVGKLTKLGPELYTTDPLTYLAYNIVDVMLCVELDILLHIIDFYIEIAILSNSNLSDMDRHKYIDNLILTFCNGMYVLPTRANIDAERMSGAIVYEPLPGLHKNVLIFDFKGMYPTIMESLHISPENKDPDGDIISANGTRFTSTKMGIIPFILLTLEKRRDEHKKIKKDALEAGDDALAHEHDLKQIAIKIISNAFYGVMGYKKFRLADRDVGDAVTSTGRMLSLAVKAHIEKLYNNLYIVIYGDSVIKDSIIPIKDEQGNVYFEKIENLFKTTEYHDITGEKDYYNPLNLKTLTVDSTGDAIWRSIKYVMRHKTSKKIKKVSITNRWDVSVTEDHSLIGYKDISKMHGHNNKYYSSRFTEVKPSQIGTECVSVVTLKYIPREIIYNNNYPKELYEFMGMFIGDDSFNINLNREINGEKNYYLYLSTGIDTEEMINKVIIPLKNKGYIKSFSVRNNNYDVTITGKKIIDIMKLFRNHNGKLVPEFLMRESEDNLKHFVRGLFESDGSISKKGENYIIKYSSIKEDLLIDIQKIMWFINIPTSIHRANNTNSYNGIDSGTYSYNLFVRNNFNFKERIGFISNRKQAHVDKIEYPKSGRKSLMTRQEFDIGSPSNITDIEYNDYVYDLEVEETHKFFANGFLVHNTDSIFVEVLHDDITYTEITSLSRKIADEINEFLPIFIKEKFHSDTCYCKIEPEDPYHTIVMLPKKTISKNESEKSAKKRYSGYRWTGENKFEFKVKGIELVKGNTAEITRYIQEKTLKFTLDSLNNTEIRFFLKDFHDKFFVHEFPIEQIGRPASLNKETDEFKVDTEIKRAVEYSRYKLKKDYIVGSSFVLYYVRDSPIDILAIDYGESIPSGYVIDMQETWKKLVVGPTETILKAIGLDWSDIIKGERANENQMDLFQSPEDATTINLSPSLLDIFN